MPPRQRPTLPSHSASSTQHRPSPLEERTISLAVIRCLRTRKPVMSNSSLAVSLFNNSSCVSGFCNRITSSLVHRHCRSSSPSTGLICRNEFTSCRQPTSHRTRVTYLSIVLAHRCIEKSSSCTVHHDVARIQQYRLRLLDGLFFRILRHCEEIVVKMRRDSGENLLPVQKG